MFTLFSNRTLILSKRGFADTGASEDTHTLPAAAGQEHVHRPHPNIHFSTNPLAGLGRGRSAVDAIAVFARRQRPLAVGRRAVQNLIRLRSGSNREVPYALREVGTAIGGVLHSRGGM